MFNQESVLKPCLNIFAFPCNGEMSLRFGLQVKRVQQICTFIMNLFTLLKHSIYISTGTQCLFQNVIKKTFAILL